jgi:hypothetical protein
MPQVPAEGKEGISRSEGIGAWISSGLPVRGWRKRSEQERSV